MPFDPRTEREVDQGRFSSALRSMTHVARQPRDAKPAPGRSSVLLTTYCPPLRFRPGQLRGGVS